MTAGQGWALTVFLTISVAGFTLDSRLAAGALCWSNQAANIQPRPGPVWIGRMPVLGPSCSEFMEALLFRGGPGAAGYCHPNTPLLAAVIKG